MAIDYDTKFITLIGTPLSQSYAARMQNAGFVSNGINYRYFYTEADSSHLSEIINGIRYMPSFVGCAITKPNKIEVMKYIDDLDPLCERIGAVNTIVKMPNGSLKGYNTDAIGFLSAFKESKIDINGRCFFCFGAGGVGRAICFSLAEAGAAKIYITDVISNSSRSLADSINTFYPTVAQFVNYGEFFGISQSEVIINASGVGMGNTIKQSPLPEMFITNGQLFFDACYNPSRTKFLEDAELKGCKVLNGLSMSLYQGVAQIELWSGKTIIVDAMREELSKIVNERD